MSEGRFADQTSHGREIVEHVSQEEQGGNPGQAVDRQAFEAPSFKGSIASAMIESFPGRAANGEISDQADGAIGETFAQVEDASEMCVQVRAVRRWIDHFRDLHLRIAPLDTSLLAKPLAALTGAVKAIGNQAVAVVANGTTAIIVAPQHPVFLILVALVTAQVDHPTGMQVLKDGMQKDFKPITSIASHSIHFQVGIMGCQLQQQSRGWHFFTPVGRLHIIQQGEAEATCLIDQLQG